MNKNSLFALPASILLFGASAHLGGAPLVSFGDYAELYFQGRASVAWESNLFRTPDDETDDVIATFSPGFELDFSRAASLYDLSLSGNLEVKRYDDQSEFDEELGHLRLDAGYNGSRLTWDAGANFDEHQSITGDEAAVVDNTLIEWETYGGNINGEYTFSPKFSFGGGFDYSNKEYTDAFEDRLSDREEYEIPVDVFYELTPKVDLSVGYRYRTAEISGNRGQLRFDPSTGTFVRDSVQGYDVDNHFFNVGARGNLLPKLTGNFKIGFNYNDPDAGATNRDEDGSIGVDADFTYAATPKLNTTLKLFRDFGSAGEGGVTESTGFNLNARYNINPLFNASARLGYKFRENKDDTVQANADREDDFYNLGARLTYTPNEYLALSAGYAYSDNDSDRDEASFDNHRVNLSASLRY